MPELHDDLDEWATSDVSIFESASELPPLDDKLAAAMLRRLRYLERRRTEITSVASAEHERIYQWEAAKLETIEHDESWIRSQLEAFMRANYQRTRQKSLDLPHGKLQLRKPRTRVEIIDERALIDWAIERIAAATGLDATVLRSALDAVRDSLVLRTRIEPAKSEIAHAVEPGGRRSIDEETHVELLSAVLSDGEVVPGVLLQRSTIDDFSVKLSDPLVSVTDDVHNDSDSTQGDEE